MTTAEHVKATVSREPFIAVTFLYGYAQRANGSGVKFPQGSLVRERRNKHGRVTLAVFEYRDKSTLRYTFRPSSGRYTYTATGEGETPCA